MNCVKEICENGFVLNVETWIPGRSRNDGM
jgi:hypothetical protein